MIFILNDWLNRLRNRHIEIIIPTLKNVQKYRIHKYLSYTELITNPDMSPRVY